MVNLVHVCAHIYAWHQSEFFEILIELANLPNFFAKLKKNWVAKWSLIFIDLTMHSHCPLCSLSLVLCLIEAFFSVLQKY